MTQPPSTGPRGKQPGPGGQFSPEELRRLRLRGDRIMGIGLFVVGIFGTIIHMSSVTEQSLVTQVALLYHQLDLGDYTRPADLGLVATTGVIAQVVNYAVWLYVAVRRWNASKRAMWCAAVGAVIAVAITLAVVTAAMFAHPEIIDWFANGAPAPSPTPTQ
ncbi:DUF6264 family protein [Gulosibacter massiliensis]|uniref:DUF6264 family protein n=1 Tax=Gulosibacter massiliensis TaxID=2479839 RepID=UPI000F6324CE